MSSRSSGQRSFSYQALNYLEPTPFFCPSCYLSQFFHILLENLLFSKPFSSVHSHCPETCVCVCVCVRVCVCVLELNLCCQYIYTFKEFVSV